MHITVYLLNTDSWTDSDDWRFTMFSRFEDRKKKKAASKEENEMGKMKHKYKKELKGAIREIRKDTQFLARQQLSDQMEK